MFYYLRPKFCTSVLFSNFRTFFLYDWRKGKIKNRGEWGSFLKRWVLQLSRVQFFEPKYNCVSHIERRIEYRTFNEGSFKKFGLKGGNILFLLLSWVEYLNNTVNLFYFVRVVNLVTHSFSHLRALSHLEVRLTVSASSETSL